jgi:TolB-like protein/Flp pilus assembly protein TadD
MKIDNETGGSRETSTGTPARVDERPRGSINFFAELKRRNVYKVAVAYAVVGWLLVQVTTQVFPIFEIPNWALRLIVLAIIIGFPIALVLAWAFEATPEGIKRTELADAMSPAAGEKKHAWIYIVAICGAISVALIFLGRYTVSNKISASANDISNKSIAVLPFESLSEDKSNAYFAEGVQDEILTRLAKVADLKVISRTSTQRFKSAPSDLREIAKQLGVIHIVEGSVQKSNDQVRVNVQLINALTDAHLWADTYDRKLTDIFSVESEIAKTIADTLQAKLTGSEKVAMSKKPTANPQAYELYLKGRLFWNRRTSADLQKSVEYYQQAIAKDPDYALAYAGLADAYVLYPDYGVGTPAEFYPKAKETATKALALDSMLGEPHAALGSVYANFDRDLAKSFEEFERSIQLNPNYATAHQWFDTTLLAMGQVDRAIAESRKANELDPLSLIVNADLAFVYLYARRFDDAVAQSRKTLEIDPNFHVVRGYLGEALQFKNQLAEALSEFRAAAAATDEPYSHALLGQACARAGLNDEAQKILAQLEEQSHTKFVTGWALAVVRLALGDKDGAIAALQTAFDQHAAEILALQYDPLFDDLHGDPRFEALLQRLVRPES